MDLPFSKNFRRRHPKLSRGLGVAIAFGAAFVVGFGYSSWALVCRAGACPSVDVLDEYQPRQTSKLFAADGRFIAELGLERRTLLKIEQIPPLVRNAFIETEDKRFYKHSGVDFMRVPGAILADLKKRSFAEGFSTITMQLARNIFPERLSREKSLVRKLKEAKVARAIEARYSKDKILELYLNQIALGNGSYGVETASQRYFGKSARDLNLAEAAMLAGLPKAPERYNPRRFPERAIQRRNTVIEVMRSGGGISDADASLASAYPLQLARKAEAGDVAPYFVEYVRQQLESQFGQRLYEQGLKVFTTLDVDLQSAAERALENQLKKIESGSYGAYTHQSFESYLARASERVGEAAAANSPYLQGAFVAMDPRSGSIRALVGGRDFDDSKFNRAVQALRQPGSTFKPIVYADAVQNGRPPSYIVDDAPVNVPQGNGSNWTPQNYDGKFEGPMPMRRGLYQSRNIIAIKVGMELGTQSVIDMARKFGLTTPIPPYPSINIGAADVYPIEMIAAYSAFATLGTRASPIAIVRVENSKGDVLWEPTATRVPVMSPEEAWLMVSMMKDVIRRGTAASVGSQFPYPTGGKTGTTNDGADVWFIGYTSDLVAGVWMGLDKPAKIKGNAQGGQLAAPAWTAFMKEVYRRKPAPPDWPRPDGIVIRDIDPMTGLLAGPGCSGTVQEYFVAGTDPIQACAPASNYPPLDSLGTRIDTSFGFPPIGTPPPRRAPSGAIYSDTTRPRIPDSTVFTRPTRPNPSTSTTQGYPSVAARPFSRDSSRFSADSMRSRRDMGRVRRDTTRARPDTTNPFRIPPH